MPPEIVRFTFPFEPPKQETSIFEWDINNSSVSLISVDADAIQPVLSVTSTE